MVNLFANWWAIEHARRVNDEINRQRRQRDEILKALEDDLEKLETLDADPDFWVLAAECAEKLQPLRSFSWIEWDIMTATREKNRNQALRLLKDEYELAAGFSCLA